MSLSDGNCLRPEANLVLNFTGQVTRRRDSGRGATGSNSPKRNLIDGSVSILISMLLCPQ